MSISNTLMTKLFLPLQADYWEIQLFVTGEWNNQEVLLKDVSIEFGTLWK